MEKKHKIFFYKFSGGSAGGDVCGVCASVCFSSEQTGAVSYFGFFVPISLFILTGKLYTAKNQ